MPLTGQKFISTPMQALGFNPNELGNCKGITMAFIEAAVAGKLDAYEHRLELLLDSKEDIVSKLKQFKLSYEEQLKEDIKGKKALTDEEQRLNKVWKFFKTVKFHQQPELIPSFVSEKQLLCEDSISTSQLIGSKKLKNRGGLVSLFNGSIIQNYLEFCNYLEHLRLILKTENTKDFPIAVRIDLSFSHNNNDTGHSIGLIYDHKADSWILADPNVNPLLLVEDEPDTECRAFFGDSEVTKLLPEAFIKSGIILRILKGVYYHDEPFALEKYPIAATIEVFTAGSHPSLDHLKNRFKEFKSMPLKSCPSNTEMANRVSLDGTTIAHVAAKYGDVEALEFVKELNSNLLSIQNDNGNAPIHFAAAFSAKALKFFITKQNHQINVVSKNGQTPAMKAQRLGEHVQVDTLIKAGADLSVSNLKDGTFALIHYCASYNDIESLKLVIAQKSKIDLNQQTELGSNAVHIAAEYNNPEIIKLLKNAGADLEGRTREHRFAPIHTAAIYGSVDSVRVLIDNHVDLDLTDLTMGCSAAFWAAYYNKPEILVLLQERGADLQKTNCNKWTPLHAAASHGSFEAVVFLLKSEKNILATNSDGQSAIYYAITQNHVHIALLLLSACYSNSLQLSASDRSLIRRNKNKLLLELNSIAPDDLNIPNSTLLKQILTPNDTTLNSFIKYGLFAGGAALIAMSCLGHRKSPLGMR
jgi:ankyrin repeat protein